MGAVMINTLAYARRLVDAGFTQQQAEIQAEVLLDAVSEHLASKADIERLESNLSHSISCLDTKVDVAVERLDTKIDVAVERLDTKFDAAIERLDTKIDSVAERLDAKIDSVAERLDTKFDSVAERLNSNIDQVENRLDDKIDLVSKDMSGTFSTRIAESKAELVRWVVGVGLLQTTLITGLVLMVLKQGT